MLRLRSLCVLALAALGATLSAAACSSTDTSGSGGHQGNPGGPVTGPADTHCGANAQPTDPAVCMGTTTGAGGAGQGGAGQGGMAEGAGGAAEGAGGAADMGDDYGATLYNAEGDDDDCKYHVKITSTPVYENDDVTFTVTLAKKADGSPATGAETTAEVFLNETHPAPNSGQTVKETSPGVYAVGPVRFDAAGRWTVRFHFYEQCVDGETSPHGHAAFYIDVP